MSRASVSCFYISACNSIKKEHLVTAGWTSFEGSPDKWSHQGWIVLWFLHYITLISSYTPNHQQTHNGRLLEIYCLIVSLAFLPLLIQPYVGSIQRLETNKISQMTTMHHPFEYVRFPKCHEVHQIPIETVSAPSKKSWNNALCELHVSAKMAA